MSTSVNGSTGHQTRQPTNQFDRNKFLLRQQHFAISEKYYIGDEQNNQILYIERPAHFLRNFGAVLAALVCGVMVGIIFGIITSLVPGEGLKIAFLILTFMAALATLFAVGIILYKKRHVYIYPDDTKTVILLEIFQDRKVQFINGTYTINDPQGQCLAKLTKNYLYNIFRKRWYCHRPDGSMLCVIKEDSIILSLLRRVLGPFFGLLRTNFIILAPEGETVIGEFNRKFTLFDRYVLDMSADPARIIDRRIALAIGVMLDTGERR